MNVIFEKGKKNEMDKTDVCVVVEDTTNEANGAGETKEETVARLKGILDEAGVEYNARLGVSKLQVLVDELDGIPNPE